MKYSLLSLCFLCSLAYAGTPNANSTGSLDTQSKPADNQSPNTGLRLVPEPEVLFYNQDYAFKVEGGNYKVESVTMDKATCFGIEENNFSLNVWWSNLDEHTVSLQVKVYDQNGKESVIERKVLLQQKLPSPYLDNTLLKLDNKVIDTDLGLQKEDILKAEKLQFNQQDFTRHDVQLTSFKMRIGDKVYESTDGNITQEMKEAVKQLTIDDVIKLEDVQGTYKALGSELKFNLNYKNNYKIVLAG